MKLHIIFFYFFIASVYSQDFLENPDFELPPSLWNATAGQFFPVNGSTIPGWSFEGVVQYVTFGANSSVRGHGIALGQDGKINQTFATTSGEKQYLLTFTLLRNDTGNCKNNASVVVSAPDSSAQFYLTLKYGKEPSEVYGHQIGKWGEGESVNLVIESEDIDAEDGAACWPVIDGLSLVTVGPLVSGNDNLLQNGGFELGPSFPNSSTNGVLLDSEPSLIESALPQWTITGTVKYINSKDLFVPQGKAAIELVTDGSGVQTAKPLTKGSNYKLEFMVGDANDSCSGDFTLGVVAGSLVQNFTVQSKGTGSGSKRSVTFQGTGESTSEISFRSYTTRQREGGGLCGPVIDGVLLLASGGYKSSVGCGGFLGALIILFLMNDDDERV